MLVLRKKDDILFLARSGRIVLERQKTVRGVIMTKEAFEELRRRIDELREEIENAS